MNPGKLILALNGYPVQKAIRELSGIQSLSPDAFIDWQERRKWSIAKFHFDNNDFYKTKVGKYFPEKWVDLPVITKQDLQQPLAALLTHGVKLSECYTAYTSGSSGIPLYFAKDKYTHAMTWALIANRYNWHGLDIGDKQARFAVVPRKNKKRWREGVKDGLMNRVRLNVFDLSEPALETYLSLFRKNAFKYVYGHTSALMTFANFLEKKSIILTDVCPSLQLCISTSELSTERHTLQFQKFFGVKHIREYGASETCITGFDNPEQTFLLTEETLYNEVVNNYMQDVGLNTPGELLTTSLFNKAFPMIKYKLGDELTLGNNTNAIYRTITQIAGRSNDMIILPGGKKKGSLVIDYLIGGTVEKISVLKEFIVRQTAIDKFIFEIVAEREFNKDEVTIFLESAATYLDDNLDIEIRYVDEIKRPASGKQRFFYSELAS